MTTETRKVSTPCPDCETILRGDPGDVGKCPHCETWVEMPYPEEDSDPTPPHGIARPTSFAIYGADSTLQGSAWSFAEAVTHCDIHGDEGDTWQVWGSDGSVFRVHVSHGADGTWTETVKA